MPLNTILAFQGTHGNRFSQRLIARHPSSSESKMTVSLAGEASFEQARRVFDEAKRFYGEGQYRNAIVRFERVRQMRGMTDEIRRDCLFNIGMGNLRLERFNTAIMYFEQYLRMPGADTEDGLRRLNEAKRGAGLPVGEGEGPEVSVDQAKEIFYEAAEKYRARQYREAIAGFERVCQLAGMPDEVYRDCLFNIGMSNLRLHRYNTAVLYFEQYLTMPGADVADGQRRLRQARRGAGLPVLGEKATTEQAREIFYEARDRYQVGDFQAAIVGFEHVLTFPNITTEVRKDTLFNLGMCYLRLRKFRKAVSYFEDYLRMPGADTVTGEARLREARGGAGLPVEARAGG